tara:strand:- start:52906 stop:53445 length:540 start_codon:yes stop_codon:yes gene_type:complete
MKIFKQVVSRIIPLDMNNVDTDMIIPAQFLTKVDKAGYGQHLFQRLRDQDPDFVLNDNRYENAEVMLTETNFGCGSSREHAVWAILQSGVRVVIAKSYSDIFYNNAANNGLLLIKLEASIVDALMMQAKEVLTTVIIDLPSQSISTETGEVYQFEYDAFRKECFLKGHDDLDYLLEAIA